LNIKCFEIKNYLQSLGNCNTFAVRKMFVILFMEIIIRKKSPVRSALHCKVLYRIER